jgi:hypothetical protein
MAESIPAPPGRIFISYRRAEAEYPAGWLYDRLVTRFGRDQVFKDVDSIELGDDFAAVIADAVGSCDALLAVIGPQWLTIAAEDGRRRLEDPNDFVRLEIEAALDRNVRVIPILIGSARMPRPDQLPASLASLARRQALELSPNRFRSDTGRLLRVLNKMAAEKAEREVAAQPAREAAAREAAAREAAERQAAERAELEAAQRAAAQKAAREAAERAATQKAEREAAEQAAAQKAAREAAERAAADLPPAASAAPRAGSALPGWPVAPAPRVPARPRPHVRAMVIGVALSALVIAVITIANLPDDSSTSTTAPTTPTTASTAPPRRPPTALQTLIHDDFSDRSKDWITYSDPQSAAEYFGGGFRITQKQKERFSATYPADQSRVRTAGGIRIDVDARRLKGSVQAEYGIMVRAKFSRGDLKDGYEFAIRDDGTYFVAKKIKGVWQQNLAYGSSGAVESGQANRLQVASAGGSGGRPVYLAFWVNGVLVAEVTDRKAPLVPADANLHAGLAKGVAGPVEVLFDNFSAYSY